MVSLAEMMRQSRKNRPQGAGSRAAENFFGSSSFNLAADQFPPPDGTAPPSQTRPEVGVMNQYGDQVGSRTVGDPVVPLRPLVQPGRGVVSPARQEELHQDHSDLFVKFLPRFGGKPVVKTMSLSKTTPRSC